MCVIMLPRRVFRCLVKTSLNLSLDCIYGLSCLSSDLKIIKKFKQSSACRLKNLWIMSNQDGLLWIQLYCELLTSFMVLNTISLLIPLENCLSFYIIKHTKRLSKIWSNYQIKCKYILTQIHFVGAVGDICN